jgi:hypothetical protein
MHHLQGATAPIKAAVYRKRRPLHALRMPELVQAVRRNAEYAIAMHEDAPETHRSVLTGLRPPVCPKPSVLSPELESFPAYHDMGSRTLDTPLSAPFPTLDFSTRRATHGGSPPRDQIASSFVAQIDLASPWKLVTPRLPMADPITKQQPDELVSFPQLERYDTTRDTSRSSRKSCANPPGRVGVWLYSLWCM